MSVHPIEAERVNGGSEKGEQPFQKGRTPVHPTLFKESIHDPIYRLSSQRNAQSPPIGFDNFWRAYPKKIARSETIGAYVRAVQQATPDLLLAPLVSGIMAMPRAGKRLPSKTARLFGRQLTETADCHRRFPTRRPAPDDECVGSRVSTRNPKPLSALPTGCSAPTRARRRPPFASSASQFARAYPIPGDHMVTTRKKITEPAETLAKIIAQRINILSHNGVEPDSLENN
jgi:hypothetical protein